MLLMRRTLFRNPLVASARIVTGLEGIENVDGMAATEEGSILAGLLGGRSGGFQRGCWARE